MDYYSLYTYKNARHIGSFSQEGVNINKYLKPPPSKWLVNGLFHLFINGYIGGYKPLTHLFTNLLGHPSRATFSQTLPSLKLTFLLGPAYFQGELFFLFREGMSTETQKNPTLQKKTLIFEQGKHRQRHKMQRFEIISILEEMLL